MMVNIEGLDKSAVLLALFNGSREQGMSFMGRPKEPVTYEVAHQAIWDRANAGHRLVFDYWCGRVLKVDLSDDEFDPHLYDRDNGAGAAARAVESVR